MTSWLESGFELSRARTHFNQLVLIQSYKSLHIEQGVQLGALCWPWWIWIWQRGRSKRECIQVCIQLIHLTELQKLTQHCVAIIPQFKKKKCLIILGWTWALVLDFLICWLWQNWSLLCSLKIQGNFLKEHRICTNWKHISNLQMF